MKKQEQETLASVSGLEKLAGAYDKTARTLRKLTKALRRVLDQVQPGPLVVSATSSKPKQARKAAAVPKKRKKLSAAARKKISDAAKARWAAKKQEAV